MLPIISIPRATTTCIFTTFTKTGKNNKIIPTTFYFLPSVTTIIYFFNLNSEIIIT